jgi:acetylornithine aminotransferase
MALRLSSKRLCAALSSPRAVVVSSSYKRYASSASAAVANSNLPGSLKDAIIVSANFFLAERQGNLKNMVLTRTIQKETSLPTPDPSESSQTARLVNDQLPYMVPTYVRPPPMFQKGEGCYLWDVENRRYLDFTAGIAVNALGHCDPEMAKLLGQQVYYLSPPPNVLSPYATL